MGWRFQHCANHPRVNAGGAAGCHLEDQEQAKRCGHRPNKVIVSTGEMVDRIKAAVDARSTEPLVLARTDALASEGLPAAIDPAWSCRSRRGADMIFAEALYSLEDYRGFTKSVAVPVLANLTEFGKTPSSTWKSFARWGFGWFFIRSAPSEP